MTRKRVDGVWQYDEREGLAELKLGCNGWLSLNELDDMIELAQQHGITNGVRYLESERTRIIKLSEKDGSGVAARDAARVIAGRLREGKLLSAAERLARLEPKLPEPGESKTVYTPKGPPKEERNRRIVAAAARGLRPAEIAKAERVCERTVKRALERAK